MRDSTTIDTDDDVFDRRYPQNYHYKRRTLSQFDSPSTSSLDSMLTGSDFLTNPNFVILFTICIIALYQFRGPIIARIHLLQTRQWGFVDVCLDMVDMTRFYIDSGWNILLSVLIRVSDNDQTQSNAREEPENANDPTRRKRRLNTKMPELEDIKLDGNVPTREPETSIAEIEPSFLDPKDYPKGWLIYDPKLGIVRKDQVILCSKTL